MMSVRRSARRLCGGQEASMPALAMPSETSNRVKQRRRRDAPGAVNMNMMDKDNNTNSPVKKRLSTTIPPVRNLPTQKRVRYVHEDVGIDRDQPSPELLPSAPVAASSSNKLSMTMSHHQPTTSPTPMAGVDDDHEPIKRTRQSCTISPKNPGGDSIVNSSHLRIIADPMTNPAKTGQFMQVMTDNATPSVSATAHEQTLNPFVDDNRPISAISLSALQAPYPCQICNRAFRTDHGLRRHLTDSHPDLDWSEYMRDVNRDATLNTAGLLRAAGRRTQKKLADAQARRADKRKIRDLLLTGKSTETESKLTKENGPNETDGTGNGGAVYRKTASGDVVLMGGPTSPTQPGTSRANNEHEYQTSTLSLNTSSSFGRYEYGACEICNLVINLSHPTAFVSHVRAHEKNMIFERKLLETHGPAFVASVKCQACKLVFASKDKLEHHNQLMHARKRKYVCKWCGGLFSTLSTLNGHKNVAHGLTLSRAKPSASSDTKLATRNLSHSVDMTANNDAAHAALEDGAIITKCEQCNLMISRPSLLVRHMARAHDTIEFEAPMITSYGINFKVIVAANSVRWECCGTEFTTRNQLLAHRRAPEHYNATEHTDDDNVVQIHDPAHQQQMSDKMVQRLIVDEPRVEDAQETITLTPDQLTKLGLTTEDAQNMVLVDDGSGTLTAYDRHQWEEMQQHAFDDETSILQSALDAAALGHV